MIKVLYPNCAGLDVHKKFVVACRLSGDAAGNTQKQLRKFSTMRADLEAMAKWLQEGECTHVAMESSGVYWKPIYNILEGLFDIVLVNAQAIKRMPGRKTDMKDAEWIATLMQHGLLQGSFIPERQQRMLRDLTRYHQSLVEERSRFANRLQKLLEDTNLKLASVATDLQGVSAQAILRAIAQGETDPKTLVEMTHGSLRSKRSEMEQALAGSVSEHHRFMLEQLLTQLDFLNQQIAQIEGRIEEQLAKMPAPFEKAVQLLDTIPGVNRPLAIVIVAEIGVDMSRFPSDRHITAWAGVAPGNNETGGKQRSGRTRHGNEHLETALVLAAHAAIQGHPSYRVDVNDTSHISFSSLCEGWQIIRDLNLGNRKIGPLLDEYCRYPGAIPSLEAQRLTAKYMIAFLKTNLTHETGYQDMLTPGWAITVEHDIEFFVTEKRNPNAVDEIWPDCCYLYFPHQAGSEQEQADRDPASIPPTERFSDRKIH